MRKFMNLFKKEIKELISAQLILSLAFTVILFYFIGNMAKTEMNKIGGAKDIYILNLDDSDLSGEILRNLALANFKINLLDVKDRESAVDFARKNNINLLLIIPEGFGPS
ncbi:MAG TPA: ABC transporter permease, partial [bacterium]|nr:ABC transporter permease [bacterium]